MLRYPLFTTPNIVRIKSNRVLIFVLETATNHRGSTQQNCLFLVVASISNHNCIFVTTRSIVHQRDRFRFLYLLEVGMMLLSMMKMKMLKINHLCRHFPFFDDCAWELELVHYYYYYYDQIDSSSFSRDS